MRIEPVDEPPYNLMLDLDNGIVGFQSMPKVTARRTFNFSSLRSLLFS